MTAELVAAARLAIAVWRGQSDAFGAIAALEAACDRAEGRRPAVPSTSGRETGRRRLYRDEVIDPSPLAGLPMGSPEHLAKSRRNGARRHVEVMAARRAATAPQEVPMSLPVLPDTVELDPLEHLAQVAAEAARARQAKVAADEAWDIARETLATAYAKVGDVFVIARIVAPGGVEAEASVALDEHPEAARTVKPKAKPGGDRARTTAADERAALVLAALERHGGNTKAAGDELGMRGNVVARIASAARARAARGEA